MFLSIYRLHYINYHRIGGMFGLGEGSAGVIDWPYKPFMLPYGMSRKDAFKVLSYLTDYIERTNRLESCSLESVSTLDSVLDLERLGFKRVNGKVNDKEIIDLFTVTGRVSLFKFSKYYKKYFEWYTGNVTFSEVQEIYRKRGIDFYDVSFTPKTDEIKTNIETSESKKDIVVDAKTVEKLLDMYLESLKLIIKENPERVMDIVLNHLQSLELIDENGVLRNPYSIVKSNDGDSPNGLTLVRKE